MGDIPGAENNRLFRAKGPGWRYMIAAIILFVGTASAIVVYAALKYQEQSRMARSFERASYDRITAARKTLDFDFLALQAVRVFYNGSDEVNRREFSVFVKPFMQGHLSIHAIEWAPRVTNSERSLFEKRAAQKGLADFRISELKSQGTWSQVSDRNEYFPVFFAEPADHSEIVLGNDLGSNPACRIAMDKARDTGQCVITNKITASHKDKCGEVRAFLPVYQKNVSLDTVEDRRHNLKGYIVGIFDLEWIIKEGLASLMPAGVDVELFDATDPSHLELLCSDSSRLEPKESEAAVVESPIFSLHFNKSFDVAGRRWSVACTATPLFIASRTTWFPLLTSMGILLLTLFLGLYLIGIANKDVKIFRLVNQLAATNHQLKKEIVDRKQAEATFFASELKYKTLYNASADAIMYADPKRGMLGGNPAAIAMFGCKDEEEFTHYGPADLSPKYQPDGSLSSVKAQEVMDVAMERESNYFQWKHKRLDGTEFFATVLLTRLELEGQPIILATVRDITEQRRAEEALQASERRLRLFAENVEDVLWTMDTSGRFTYFSPSVEQMFGFKWEEGMQFTLTDIVAPSSSELAQAILKRFADQAKCGQQVQSQKVELELRRKDGSTLWGEPTINAMYDESGEVIGLLGVTRDITEQRQKNAALEESENRYRQLFTQISDAVFVADVESRMLVDCNKRAELMTGYSRAEILSMRADQLHPKLVREDTMKGFWEQAKGASEKYLESKVLSKSGKVIPVLISAGPVKIGDKQYLIGVFKDISEQKRIEEERALSARRMKSLLALNHMADSSMEKITAAAVEYAIGLTGSKIGYLASVNEDESVLTMQYWSKSAHASCKIPNKSFSFRLDELALLGEPVQQRQPVITNDYTTLNTNKHGIPEGHIPIQRQMSIPVFEGKKIVAVAGVGNKPSDYDERDLAQLRLLMDVWHQILSRKKFALELAQARDDAEAATRSKSQFLASMSHEIRTPMTAILGYADLLMDPSLDTTARNDYAITIRRSGEHLLALINDILDLSKIEAGKMTLDIGPCCIVTLLADVASVVRPRAEANHISFTIKYLGKIPKTIQADVSRLRQAIINLAGNAVKFTETGSVQIEVLFVEKEESLGNQPAIRFQVIDTGIGIREEVLPKLFQPFSQGDVSVTQKFGGTGLGLAISYHIAHLLGGELTVSSVWGEGSTFTLTVPTGSLDGVPMLHNPAEVAHDDRDHVWQPSTQELLDAQILLAEDGEDNRRLIRLVLSKAGAKVETAENGRLAVEQAQNGEFDLILMDMNMPEMDGYEATSILRSQGYSKPILALTANAMKEDCERCRLAGCDAYLTKPIDRMQLVQTIAKYVHALKEDNGARQEEPDTQPPAK